MRIISKGTLRTFWETIEYKDSEQQLKSWYNAITDQDWQSPNDIIALFKNTDTVGNNRLVFNICRNKYRLVVYFRYDTQIGFIRFIGTHKEYDKIKEINKI